MKKIRFNLMVLSAAALASISYATASVTVVGPTKDLKSSFDVVNDTLLYDFTKDDKVLIAQSPILIELDNELLSWTITSKKNKSKKAKDSFELLTGEVPAVKTRYVQSVMDIEGVTPKGKKVSGQLFVRLYESAMAYRFVLDLDEKASIREYTAYRFATTEGHLFAPNGDREPLGPMTTAQMSRVNYTTPALYAGDGFVLGFHEADLHNYPQLLIKSHRSKEYIEMANSTAELSGHTELPWRIIYEGESIADIHNNKSTVYSLSKEAEGDFSWVQPGRAAWDWRVKGTTFGGVKYTMTTQSLKRYIDFCARNGIEYFLIDDEWYKDKTPLVPVKGLDLEEVIRYGLEKGVGTLVYYDLSYMKFTEDRTELDFDSVASQLASWGAKGIKFGFLGVQGIKYNQQEKSFHSEEIIRIAAKHKLIVDFHDTPIPFGGLMRQYPNYISREYCHAQMDSRRSFTPEAFVNMACVNFLAGPIDQTNGTYALNTIKDRSKGPKNEYNSTVSSETARYFITHTGNLSVLLDAPEAYEQKADLFDFIRRMPSRWDEAKYLDMQYNRYVSVARRSGTTWFVGTVFSDNEQGEHTIKLDFLAKGKSYKVTIYSDAADTDYTNNKESYKVSSKTITAGDVITTNVAKGGGYSLLLEQL